MLGELYVVFFEFFNFVLYCIFFSLFFLVILFFLNFKYDWRVLCCGELNSCGWCVSNVFVKFFVVFCVFDFFLWLLVVCFWLRLLNFVVVCEVCLFLVLFFFLFLFMFNNCWLFCFFFRCLGRKILLWLLEFLCWVKLIVWELNILIFFCCCYLKVNLVVSWCDFGLFIFWDRFFFVLESLCFFFNIFWFFCLCFLLMVGWGICFLVVVLYLGYFICLLLL